KTNGPLFRQFETAAEVSEAAGQQYASPGENRPGADPTRIFPDLAQILANDTNAETGTCPEADVKCFSEFLPTSAYVGTPLVNANPPSLHFRLTARDGRPDGGGVNTAATTLILAPNAGPFLVTSPNDESEKYRGGSALTVTWDVANTNLAPVLTANVRILLSFDGGHTYPRELGARRGGGAIQRLAPDPPDHPGQRCRLRGRRPSRFRFRLAGGSLPGAER